MLIHLNGWPFRNGRAGLVLMTGTLALAACSPEQEDLTKVEPVEAQEQVQVETEYMVVEEVVLMEEAMSTGGSVQL